MAITVYENKNSEIKIHNVAKSRIPIVDSTVEFFSEKKKRKKGRTEFEPHRVIWFGGWTVPLSIDENSL